ncbi:MAG: hypothetical protein ABSA75_03980 [Candidatus Bathyarchaeia archaeon]|jgi:hypothetical protein
MSEKQTSQPNKAGELEQEARIALLQHYSSKSSNEATNTLTIALVFFAFISALATLRTIPGNWVIFISALVLASLIALTVHTALRLLYWGTLAGYAVQVDFITLKRLKKISDDTYKTNAEKDYQKLIAEQYKKKKAELKYSIDEFRKKEELKCSIDDFTENLDAKDIEDGLKPNRDDHYYESASQNMLRLTEGCQLTLNDQARENRLQRLTMYTGMSDLMLAVLGCSLLILGSVYFYYDLPFTRIPLIFNTALISLISTWIIRSVVPLICGSLILRYWSRAFRTSLVSQRGFNEKEEQRCERAFYPKKNIT